ncbi:protein of unknown function [Amycolatopsis marina]|uniref:DUF397 domain-containing protein n=1 Tax=Amycolatopsis marina TaxID=490629 RepID=A0A1I1CGW7_9PSEU|nr:DUF397 domain-containing protein [Amycolatopsis marina]SFB61292.1 protein of unknown function [Amycolatopsis marina]
MTTRDHLDLTWRKSTHSDNLNGDCVEVALTPDTTAVRDSKAPGAGHLSLSTDAWRGFLETVSA